jgi:hypothetical protein
MSTAALLPADQPLYDLVNGPAPTTIADVIARMQAIDAQLPASDGLKWFNLLYLMVTQQVDLHPPGGAWQSPVWLNRLDVVFAGFYFRSIVGSIGGQAVPSAWNALFEARYRTGIDRIQFALAGMNAHINHDLALALLASNLLTTNPSTSCSTLLCLRPLISSRPTRWAYLPRIRAKSGDCSPSGISAALAISPGILPTICAVSTIQLVTQHSPRRTD